jgi:purine-binding chemotaxis protein CheW
MGVNQYVSFTLGGERYAADIERVQEIKGFESVTRIPDMPDYLLGVVNLRGAIVPIIDLRVRFSLQHAPFDASTVILVVRVNAPQGERTAGIVVDSVDEVQSLEANTVQPPPALMGLAERSFIKGVASLEGRTLMLIDIEQLVNASVASA